jgi:cytochrome c oxidase subunit II
VTRGRATPSLALAALPLLAACEGPQRVFAPAGPGAEEIGRLGMFLIVATVVPALVVIAIAVAAALRRRRPPPGGAETERRDERVVVAAGVASALLIGVLVLANVWVGRRVVAPPDEPAFDVEIVAHQFWWEVRYPQHGIASANELHVPAGSVVRVLLSSADVIHSLWIPELQGKLDAMPGRVYAKWLRADRPGEYRGQCAEFCGLQHARMAFWVVAHPPEEFARFLERERPPRAPAVDPVHVRGARVFAAARCDACHAVRGHHELEGLGSPGPDLTHLGSRRTLAAGTLPMTEEALAEWILDPARAKPGVRMPATDLAPEDLEALVTWLLASPEGGPR